MLHRARAFPTEGAHFSIANALDLPFEKHCFDYVISASLINIIADPGMALREMVRVCKPGGKVSVLVPQAGVADEDIIRLAKELNLAGFSHAALTAWHLRAPKMQREILQEYFSHAGLHGIFSETHLHGMVLTVTGTRSI